MIITVIIIQFSFFSGLGTRTAGFLWQTREMVRLHLRHWRMRWFVWVEILTGRLSVCYCEQLYLMKYGYMEGPTNMNSSRSAPLLSPDGLQDYVRNLQSFAGLPQTGELDQQTAELMKLPR